MLGVAMVVALFATSKAEAAPYRQVVDNSTKDRFKTSTKWDLNSYNSQKYGKNYRAARPAKRGLAAYKVKTPATGFYTVCATWPANKKYNPRTTIFIKTHDSTKGKFVNQRRNGGKWNKLGTWKLRKGDSYKIMVSRKSKRGGWIVADAFKIIRSPDSKGVSCRQATADRGKRVVRAAAKYIGTPYVLGGLGDCVPNRRMDCSCLTRTAYKDATNIADLPDDPAQQWNYGRKVSKPRPGDIVFYKEGTNKITHNGIYAGNGEIIHASNYFGKTVRKPMRWPGDGYVGARRLV
jgi:cell wall-associated NlpC family hydrolase